MAGKTIAHICITNIASSSLWQMTNNTSIANIVRRPRSIMLESSYLLANVTSQKISSIEWQAEWFVTFRCIVSLILRYFMAQMQTTKAGSDRPWKLLKVVIQEKLDNTIWDYSNISNCHHEIKTLRDENLPLYSLFKWTYTSTFAILQSATYDWYARK